MRAPDFLINLFTRICPIDKNELANLKISLSEWYLSQLEKFNMKNQQNEELAIKLDNKEKELDALPPNTPEYGAKLKEIEEIQFEFEEPTIVEKSISFLEKPMVRVFLMTAFSVLSWWIMKKITSKSKEVEEPETEDLHQYPNSGQFYQGHNQQYSGGYWVPNQPPYPNQQPQQRRGY